MEKDPRFPQWLELITLWLKTHYLDKTCVVFHSGGYKSYEYILEHFKTPHEKSGVIMSEYTILPTDTLDEALRICNATPEGRPFTVVWENDQIVHENT